MTPDHPGTQLPTAIEVRGARVHNLDNIDVDVPLNQLVGVAGVSGSGKSSLALGVLYAEGSRRYIEALSTYTRRRMTQASRADVDQVRYVPAALALRQRPAVPGVRSTFGTSTELLNVIRLMFSRLGAHLCPNGHRQQPTLNVATEDPLICPTCGVEFYAPEAEQLAFNSEGACPRCEGTGTVRDVDDSTLIRDESLSIDEGTVIPWQMYGFNVQPQIVREFGVRTDVAFGELADWERNVVFSGPEEKKHITVTTKNGVHELDFTFRNARLTITKELERAEDDRRLARVSRFLIVGDCPDCAGTRLSDAARAPRIGAEAGQDDHDGGHNLAEVTAMTLDDVVAWTDTVVETVSEEMAPMAGRLVETLTQMARRLLELGLGYLSLDRAGATLSTGERQRVQLARAVRNATTGVLYVLDEPSIGLHPSNVAGLQGVVDDLLAEGNSVVMVDHDTQVLRAADHLIEIGPGSGRDGGTVVAQGTVAQLGRHQDSLIGGFLTGAERVVVRDRTEADKTFDDGAIRLRTDQLHTVHPLDVAIPRGRLNVITGVSGSGKTTMVLDSLVPALRAEQPGSSQRPAHRRPAHVRELDPGGIQRVTMVDATPIGVNVRSTVATYTGVLDDLRQAYARLDAAGVDGLGAGDFSYNTGSLRCPRCEGTGEISLDIQFLPDVDIECPDCEGSRYSPDAERYRRTSDSVGSATEDAIDNSSGPGPATSDSAPTDSGPGSATSDSAPTDSGPGSATHSLPELLSMTVAEAIGHVRRLKRVATRMQALIDVGLGYLTLHESTPSLSGGEAQRLKLVTELNRRQSATLFVFDEPTVGLHPLDVRVLIDVLQRLIDQGGTVIVIEHDLDLIANADHIIDMGPSGGVDGGRIVATGTPDQVVADQASATGEYLAAHLRP